MSAPICPTCAGQGYVTVLSPSKRAFIGICDCAAGQPYLADLDDAYRWVGLEQRLGVSRDRIWTLADLRETVGTWANFTGKVTRA